MNGRSRYRLGVSLAIVAGAAAIGIPSLAMAASYQGSELRFSEKRPGASSGVRFSVDYVNPADPAAKPPPVRRVELIMAKGSQFDVSVPAACTATDLELMAFGGSFCPPDSNVGAGSATVDTGIPGPARIVGIEIDFRHNGDQLIYVNSVMGSPARVVFRGTVSGRTIDTTPPPTPGAPPGGTAIDTVDVYDPPMSRVIDGVQRNYLTTPRRCPARGFWVNRARFTYDGGVVQTVKTRSRCRIGGSR